MTRFSALSLVATVVAGAQTASPASAATTALTSFENTVYPADTRLSGSATSNAYAIDGTHSTVLLTSTTNNVDHGQEKVAPYFYTGAGTPIGTLGDLGRGDLTFDWQLNSTSGAAANIAAFRILVDGPTPGTFAEINWESAYQSSIPTFNVGQKYNDYSIGGGQYWIRYLGQNYGQGDNGPGPALTLAQLAAGGAEGLTAPHFTDSTNVYGVTVSVGSGAGDYNAYVGDINASFVPEPASLALIGVGAAGLLMRRRRTAHA